MLSVTQSFDGDGFMLFLLALLMVVAVAEVVKGWRR